MALSAGFSTTATGASATADFSTFFVSCATGGSSSVSTGSSGTALARRRIMLVVTLTSSAELPIDFGVSNLLITSSSTSDVAVFASTPISLSREITSRVSRPNFSARLLTRILLIGSAPPPGSFCIVQFHTSVAPQIHPPLWRPHYGAPYQEWRQNHLFS